MSRNYYLTYLAIPINHDGSPAFHQIALVPLPFFPIIAYPLTLALGINFPTPKIHANQLILHKQILIKPSLNYLSMHSYPLFHFPRQSTRLENKWVGVVIARDAIPPKASAWKGARPVA